MLLKAIEDELLAVDVNKCVHCPPPASAHVKPPVLSGRIVRFGKKNITEHVWRCPAASVLAKSGISLINLKRSGRWKNLESTEEYI